VGCVLRARHGTATGGPDVHGERSPPDHLQPAAGQPTGSPGSSHHQDSGIPLQVPPHVQCHNVESMMTASLCDSYIA